MSKRGVLAVAAIIWLIAALFALPNLIWRRLETHHIGLTKVSKVSFCFEQWPPGLSRASYSIVTLALQFFTPIVTVSAAYCGISCNLRARRERSAQIKAAKSTRIAHEEETMPSNNISRIYQENETEMSSPIGTMGCGKRMCSKNDCNRDPRLLKVNQLLSAITVVFCISWLPLNLFNCIVDFMFSNDQATESMLVVYAACHLCGMSSACTNPFLYGWLNNNFKTEFTDMLLCRQSRVCRCQCMPLKFLRTRGRKCTSFNMRDKSRLVANSMHAKVSTSFLNTAEAPLETSFNEANQTPPAVDSPAQCNFSSQIEP